MKHLNLHDGREIRRSTRMEALHPVSIEAFQKDNFFMLWSPFSRFGTKFRMGGSHQGA